MAASISDTSQKLQELTKHFSSFNQELPQESFSENQNLSSQRHYEVPNLTSMLYEFTNKEQERILQGFRIGNFVSLRELPHDLLAGNVLNAQKEKIDKNIYSPRQAKTYVELQSGGGYFSKFEYMPEPFDNFLEKERQDSKNSKQKQEQLHEKLFILHPNKSTPYKHQDQFWNDEQYSSFFGADDPYEATKFEVLRARWIEDSKILYGDFKPANSLHSLKLVNKQHIPNMVGEIKRNLLADWSDINFIIGTNPEDFIEMRFDLTSLDSPKGLHAYMNNLVNMSDLLIKYQLRRVSEFWGLRNDEQDYIYYMLAPPWVKIKNPKLYLQQIQ